MVGYDVDFPVDATYRLRVRYASAGVRPLEVWIDDKRVGECCFRKTNNSPPYMDRHPNVWEGLPERTWHMHGAEWEDSCTMKVAKGKHTLKFTRNGPPANPIEIELVSSVPFLEDWKPTPRKVDISRIPVRYRNAHNLCLLSPVSADGNRFQCRAKSIVSQPPERGRDRRLLVARGIHHSRPREGARPARGCRFRGGDQKASPGPRLHVLG